MKPTTQAAGEATAASEPSNEGSARSVEGGATAPTQKDEQALQAPWDCFSTSDADESVSEDGSADWPACSPPW